MRFCFNDMSEAGTVAGPFPLWDRRAGEATRTFELLIPSGVRLSVPADPHARLCTDTKQYNVMVTTCCRAWDWVFNRQGSVDIMHVYNSAVDAIVMAAG